MALGVVRSEPWHMENSSLIALHLSLAALIGASAASAQTLPTTRLSVKEVRIGSLEGASRYAVSRDSNHFAALLKKDGKFLVVRDQRSGKEYDWIISATLFFTPDSQHLAYLVQQDGKLFLVLDDVEGPRYHEILKSQYWMSLAGNRIACIARRAAGGKPFMVVDGQEGREFDDVGAVIFSADGQHYAYPAELDGRQLFVVDGAPTPSFDRIAPLSFAFSPDARRSAFIAMRTADKKAAIVADGSVRQWADEVGRPFFSPDGKRLAAAIRRGASSAVVLDDKELGDYERIVGDSIRFSPDSTRLAFAAARMRKTRDAEGREQNVESFLYVLDGQELRDYESLGPFFFSPDSRRTAYIAIKNKRVVAVIDGSEGKYYEEIRQPQFSPDSRRFVYLASREGRWYSVVDGSEGPAYSQVGNSILFSPDSKRMVYVASRGARAFVVLNGAEGPSFSAVAWDTLAMSPDGRHIACAAARDQAPLLVVDDQELAAGAGPLVGSRLVFDSPDSLHALIVRGKDVLRLQIDIGRP